MFEEFCKNRGFFGRELIAAGLLAVATMGAIVTADALILCTLGISSGFTDALIFMMGV